MCAHDRLEGGGSPSHLPSLFWFLTFLQSTIQNNLNPQIFACNVQTVLEHEEIILQPPPSHPAPKSDLKSRGLVSKGPLQQGQKHPSPSHHHHHALTTLCRGFSGSGKNKAAASGGGRGASGAKAVPGPRVPPQRGGRGSPQDPTHCRRRSQNQPCLQHNPADPTSLTDNRMGYVGD